MSSVDPPDPPAPSRDEIILTEAFRRRVLATAQRCLPAIIRDAGYEELDELLDIFFWFGSPEAMRLEEPEGYRGTPGLTLEEGNALVKFRMMRGECHVPPGCAGPEAAPAPGDPPSREEVIVIQAFRRRATAMTERCLPTIIREAEYEKLEEINAIFRWFGSPEAMQLQTPEDYASVPGLLLEEAKALVRLRIKLRAPTGSARTGSRKPHRQRRPSPNPRRPWHLRYPSPNPRQPRRPSRPWHAHCTSPDPRARRVRQPRPSRRRHSTRRTFGYSSTAECGSWTRRRRKLSPRPRRETIFNAEKVSFRSWFTHLPRQVAPVASAMLQSAGIAPAALPSQCVRS